MTRTIAGVQVPRQVWWLTGVLTALLVTYSIVLPTYRAPDEPHHLDLVRKVREGHGYPDLRSSYISDQVMASLPLVDFSARSRHLERDEAMPRAERPTLAELAVDRPSAQTNQMPQHPPLYYTAAAVQTTLLSAVVPGLRGAPYDIEVGLYRLLNLLFVVPLPVLAYIAATRLRLPRSAAVAAATVPLAIPMMVHIGSSVTNDNLLTLLFAIDFVALCGVWRGDERWTTALVVGAATALALLTKAFAFVLLPWIAFSYALGYVRTRRPTVAWAGFLALCTATAAGGWWWIRTLVVYGELLPSRRAQREAPAEFSPEVWGWLADYAEWLNARFWGWFGWVDVRMPHVAVVVASAVLVGGLVVAFTSRRSRLPKVEAAALLVPIASLLLFVTANSYRNYLATGVADSAVQGRYLFPGVLGLGVVAVSGWAALVGKAGRWFPVSVFGAALVLHGVAVVRLVSAFWGPPGAGVDARLGALVAWSPWPPVVTVGVLVITPLVAVVTAVVVWPRQIAEPSPTGSRA